MQPFELTKYEELARKIYREELHNLNPTPVMVNKYARLLRSNRIIKLCLSLLASAGVAWYVSERLGAC